MTGMRSTAAGRAIAPQHRPAPIDGHQADLFGGVDLKKAAELQFFPSQPWTARAVWELLGPRIFPTWPTIPPRTVLYEICAGQGHLVEPLRETFPDVRPSDIYDWGKGYPLADALAFEADDDAAISIGFTNPPFNKPKGMAARLVRQMQKTCDHVIVLCGLGFLCSEGRYDLHNNNPLGNLRHVVVLSERAPMQLGKYNPDCDKPQEIAFFHYQRGYTGNWTGLNIQPGARDRLFREEDLRI